MPVYLPPISRRRFLGSSFAAAAALALGPGCASTTANRDEHGVALISDVHIAANPRQVAHTVNMTDNLSAVTSEVLALPQLPQMVIINGDLAFNEGTKEDYAAVLELIRPMRDAGLPLHMGMGNHDDRGNFWTVLREDKTVPADLPNLQAAIIRTGNANWFILDSLIRTRTTPGLLGDAQRAWLAAALDANADKPAIIMIHHQPLTIFPEKKDSCLQDTAELMAILRPRRQVKAYFCGHTHRWKTQQDASGIHLVNLPTTAYLFDEGEPNGWVHATVNNNGVRLRLNCINKTHPANGQIINLDWRTA